VDRATVNAGLCAACRHARRIRSGRGSTFVLCERAADDARYLRYPTLPVMRCSGHEPIPPGAVTREP
jgi:hypothetical protein